MKSELIISNRKHLEKVFFLVMLMMCYATGYAQKTKEVSISVYPGFTIVNFEKALGYTDNNLENWDEFHLAVAVRGFLLSEKRFQFGAEAAWQKLYYAYYVIPYGTSTIYREYNVTSTSLMILGRYTVNKLFLIGGAGFHSFNSGISPALCFEAGFSIKAGENIKIPISIRLNPIFGSGTPTPVSIGAGVSFALN